MNNEMIYEKAEKDYFNLCSIVKDFKGNLEELYSYLGGHNFDKDLFDVNFGCICATITEENKLFKVSNAIEIWDDQTGTLVSSYYCVI